jgi:hypothetical protein
LEKNDGIIKILNIHIERSLNSGIGIATVYGLDNRGVGVRRVRVPVGSGIFSSPSCPDRFWGPPNLLYNRYQGSFPGGKAASAWSWPLSSNYCRGQANVDLYINPLICLNGIVLNLLNTGRNLPYSYRNLNIQDDGAMIKFCALINVMDPPLPILRTNCNFNTNIFISYCFWILQMMSIWIDELNVNQNLSNCIRKTSSHHPQTVFTLKHSS